MSHECNSCTGIHGEQNGRPPSGARTFNPHRGRIEHVMSAASVVDGRTAPFSYGVRCLVFGEAEDGVQCQVSGIQYGGM